MRITTILAGAFVMLASLGIVGASLAQETDELADAHHDLEVAREQLEVSAREVARLSAQANEPFFGSVMRDFQRSGRRAMLGINIADDDDGVVVVGVSPGGPAAESGLKTGDIIVATEKVELASSETSSPSEVLIRYMASVMPGESVSLTIARDGEEHEVEVEAHMLEAHFFSSPFASPAMPLRRGNPTISGRPGSIALYNPIRTLLGELELVELTADLGAYFGTTEGILVVRAPSNNRLELQDGDVLLEIGGRMPTSTWHAMRIFASFEPGEALELSIMRSQRRETIKLELPNRDWSG